jgi:polysaccharide biosynthesis transport protein
MLWAAEILSMKADMLQHRYSPSDPSPYQAAQQPAALDIAGIFSFLRRHRMLIGLSALSGLFLGIAYLVITPPSYTATAALLLDARKNQTMQLQRMGTDLPIDSSMVDSQVEVIRSETIAQKVIDDLKLLDNEDKKTGVIAFVKSFFEDGNPVSEEERRQRLTGIFAQNLQTKRLGLSYVIEISYRDRNAERAAAIANAIADNYLTDQLDSKFQSARRANQWLQARIQELREQASEADRKVQDFKAKNNIVETGRGLMNEQQLGEINTQMVMARAQTAEAKARLDRIDSILKSDTDVIDGAVSDVLRSEVITRLRQQYLEVSRREAEWSNRYGILHSAAINLRNEMRQIKTSIDSELSRIAATFRSDFEIARTREESLQQDMNRLIQQSADTNQDRVALRELESGSQTSRALYDNFLQRYLETTQQESFPVTEARVITPAARPQKKSHPKSTLVAAASLVLGLMAGLALALLRDQLDRVFRTEKQVSNHLQLECLGYLPMLSGGKTLRPARVPAAESRELEHNLGVMRRVIDHPLSHFAETLRAMKIRADLQNAREPLKVLGVLSSEPGEGKSTISSNLAQLAAHGGRRVILMDLDLRNPSLSRALVPSNVPSVQDVLAGRVPLDAALWRDPVTGLHFLPADGKGRVPHSAEVLQSNEMRALLKALSGSYDHIVLDLPPLGPIVDSRGTSSFVDGYFMVIEWGRTTQDKVAAALDSAPMLRNKILGAVLNKADMRRLNRFDENSGSSYYGAYREYVTGS